MLREADREGGGVGGVTLGEREAFSRTNFMGVLGSGHGGGGVRRREPESDAVQNVFSLSAVTSVKSSCPPPPELQVRLRGRGNAPEWIKGRTGPKILSCRRRLD